MHIQAGNGHRVALSNMFRMASRHVVLMENFKRHQFVAEIQQLHDGGMIGWPAINFYFRRQDGAPHILIASKEPLAFETLDDYRQLVDAMKWEPPAGQ
jgi:hypothetical protein